MSEVGWAGEATYDDHEHSYIVIEWEPQAKQVQDKAIAGDMWMLSETGEWREVNNSQARRLKAKRLMCSTCLNEREL